AVVEEVERDHVLKELVRRFRDAQVEAVLPVDGAPNQEFDADRGLAGPDGPGDEDRVPSSDASVQDVVERVDTGDASLPLAVRMLLRGHRFGRANPVRAIVGDRAEYQIGKQRPAGRGAPPAWLGSC